MTRGISINRFTLSSPNDCGRKIVLPRGGLLCWGEALGWRVYGYLLFIKINSTLAYQGQALVIIPPERPTFDANPVDPLVATNTGGEIDLKLSVPSATPKLLWRAGRIISRIYHPLSNGMLQCPRSDWEPRSNIRGLAPLRTPTPRARNCGSHRVPADAGVDAPL
jgi:hypothetical protein